MTRINWIAYSLSIVVLILVGSTARAAPSECNTRDSLQLHGEGSIVSGFATQLKAVAYTVPRTVITGQEDAVQVRKDFSAIKSLGFNAVRGYEPMSPTVLQAAEEAGLFVVQALVHLSDDTNFDSDEELRDVIERAQQIVNRDRCRQGVAMWSLWNDAPFNWGSSGGNVVERFGPEVVHQFLKRLRDAVKQLDPSRYLTAANVLNARHAEIGMDLLDVIGVNVYIGVFDWPSQRYSDALAVETIARVKQISEKYGKPIWISETGVASIPGAHAGDIVIPRQLQLIEEAKFLGFAVFQWRDDPYKAGQVAEVSRDIEANWGLLTSSGNPKPALAGVADALRPRVGARNNLYTNLSDPWLPLLEGSLASSQASVLVNFGFKNAQLLRAAYRVRTKGRAHAYITKVGPPNEYSTGLSVHYVPEDYGAWLTFGRTFSQPIQLPTDGSLIVDLGEYRGGAANLTMYFMMKGGRVMRTPPLLLRNHKPKSYRLAIQELIADNGATVASLDIEEFYFKLNDVANFEEVGLPVQLVIHGIRVDTARK